MTKRKLFKGGDDNLKRKRVRKLTGVKRRSVSVNKFVDDSIGDFRAAVAMSKKGEVDYTTALNMFAELGIRKFSAAGTHLDPEQFEVCKKYLGYDEPKECSAFFNEWQDFQEFKEWKMRRAKTVQK